MSTLPLKDKSYTHKDLADVFQVSPRILHRWFRKFSDELGEKVGHYYNHRQIDVILKHCGIPPRLQKTEDESSDSSDSDREHPNDQSQKNRQHHDD